MIVNLDFSSESAVSSWRFANRMLHLLFQTASLGYCRRSVTEPFRYPWANGDEAMTFPGDSFFMGTGRAYHTSMHALILEA